MEKYELLEPGNFYHVYNHGVGGRNVFIEPDNYQYFLGLYDKYISAIADTYAWALMPNHFHFLVKLKEPSEILTNPFGVENPERVKNLHSNQFSKLFNAYAQALNKRYGNRGGLFEKRFKRKRINNPVWLKSAILYIHNNPVHHGFCSHPLEYPWTSYMSCISIKPTKIVREKVVGWFDNNANFITLHGEKTNFNEIEKWILE
jgi:REP element-mobilizing transposase RayT